MNTVTLHRIGTQLYNLAAFARIDLEPNGWNRPTKPGPYVEMVSLWGADLHATGDQAEALRDYFEGRADGVAHQLPGGVTIVDVHRPAPEPPRSSGIW